MTQSTISSLSSDIQSQIYSEINKENCEIYTITQNTLNQMGLNELEGDNKYLVVYDSENFNKMDIVYIDGFDFDGTKYYTLSKVQEIDE